MSAPSAPQMPPCDVARKVIELAKHVAARQLVRSNGTVCDLLSDGSHSFEIWKHKTAPQKVWTLVHPQELPKMQERWQEAGAPEQLSFVGCHVVEEMGEALQGAEELDAVCCLSGLGRCFDSLSSAHRMLGALVPRITKGGFFFGICLDSTSIWGKAIGGKGELLPQPVKKKHYVINISGEFEEFGTRAELRFHGPGKASWAFKETLVHFPTMIDVLEYFGMEFVDIMNLGDFFELHKRSYASQAAQLGIGRLDAVNKAAINEYAAMFALFVFRKPGPLPQIEYAQPHPPRHLPRVSPRSSPELEDEVLQQLEQLRNPGVPSPEYEPSISPGHMAPAPPGFPSPEYSPSLSPQHPASAALQPPQMPFCTAQQMIEQQVDLPGYGYAAQEAFNPDQNMVDGHATARNLINTLETDDMELDDNDD